MQKFGRIIAMVLCCVLALGNLPAYTQTAAAAELTEDETEEREMETELNEEESESEIETEEQILQSQELPAETLELETDEFETEEETEEESEMIIELPVEAYVDTKTTEGYEGEVLTSENAEMAAAEEADDSYVVEEIEETEPRLRNFAAAAATTYQVAKASASGGFSVQGQYSSFSDAKKEMEKLSNSASSYLDKNSYVVLYGSNRVVAMVSGMAAITSTQGGTLSYSMFNGGNTGYMTNSTTLYYYGSDSLNSIQVGAGGCKFTTSYENLLLIPTPFLSPHGTGNMKGKYERDYYTKNSSGELVHYITTLVDLNTSTHYEAGEKTSAASVVIDEAPSFMATGTKYYSMDGINYYKDEALTSKAGTYYPYYQYLSYHSESDYSAADLNKFISYYVSQYGQGKTSKMLNSGSAFIEAQQKYGINALLEFAFACHESAYGTSTYAVNRNNLFGIQAYDNDPNQASYFTSVADCVKRHAEVWLKQGYLDPATDSRYFGANAGNKATGINVKYASDPYHGEKIAGWAYRIDKYLGFGDYNAETIGVTNTVTTVYAGASTSSSLYKLTNRGGSMSGVPVVVLSESGSYYQVQSDMPIVNGKVTPTGTYSFSHVGYAAKSNITVVREGSRGTWKKENGKWYYIKKDGTKATGWIKDKGKWYYLNGSGVMQTGWVKLSNKWYYLNGSGAMQTGWVKLSNKWYYLNGSGVMQTGLVKVGNKSYYLNGSGVMQTGWVKLSGKWYYFDGSGAMKTGWVKVSNNWYYLNGSGVMQTGWIKLSNKWYYLQGSGAMKTGWLKSGSKWYYLQSSGAMKTGWAKVSNKWYYMNGSGAMQTGWVKVSNRWYYLNGSGAMLTGWVKVGNKSYYMNSSGAWTGQTK